MHDHAPVPGEECPLCKQKVKGPRTSYTLRVPTKEPELGPQYEEALAAAEALFSEGMEPRSPLYTVVQALQLAAFVE